MIIILFILLVLFTIIENQREVKFHQVLFLFSLFTIVILESIKFDCGMDFWFTYNHYNHFKLFNENDRYEMLYRCFVYVFKSILNVSYPVFLFFYFSTVYGLYYFSLNKITKFPITALLLVFSCTVGLLGSNRQLLAISIGFFSIVYFLKDKKILYISLILVATFFHYSAFFYILLLFLDRKIHNIVWYIILLLLIIINITGFNYTIFNSIINSVAPDKILNIIKKYNIFFAEMQSNYYLFIIGIARRSLPIFFLIQYKDKLKQRASYQLLLNCLFFSLAIYLFFFGRLEYMSSRISVYFIIIEVIAYMWIQPIFSAKYGKKIYLLCLLIFASVEFIKYVFTDSTPFIPFKTIFFIF